MNIVAVWTLYRSRYSIILHCSTFVASITSIPLVRHPRAYPCVYFNERNCSEYSSETHGNYVTSRRRVTKRCGLFKKKNNKPLWRDRRSTLDDFDGLYRRRSRLNGNRSGCDGGWHFGVSLHLESKRQPRPHRRTTSSKTLFGSLDRGRDPERPAADGIHVEIIGSAVYTEETAEKHFFLKNRNRECCDSGNEPPHDNDRWYIIINS